MHCRWLLNSYSQQFPSIQLIPNIEIFLVFLGSEMPITPSYMTNHVLCIKLVLNGWYLLEVVAQG